MYYNHWVLLFAWALLFTESGLGLMDTYVYKVLAFDGYLTPEFMINLHRAWGNT